MKYKKPTTLPRQVMRDAPSRVVINKPLRAGTRIVAHDSVAENEAMCLLALDLADALKQADVAQKMNDLGSTVVGNKPDEFRQFVTRQIEMWAEGVKISGATVD
jgi:UDP-glucose 6-dehydrogenase